MFTAIISFIIVFIIIFVLFYIPFIYIILKSIEFLFFEGNFGEYLREKYILHIIKIRNNIILFLIFISLYVIPTFFFDIFLVVEKPDDLFTEGISIDFVLPPLPDLFLIFRDEFDTLINNLKNEVKNENSSCSCPISIDDFMIQVKKIMNSFNLDDTIEELKKNEKEVSINKPANGLENTGNEKGNGKNKDD
jgi:hypothetical protein